MFASLQLSMTQYRPALSALYTLISIHFLRRTGNKHQKLWEGDLLTYLLTYSMVQSPSWEANWFAASQENPAFHGTRKFITALTSIRHLSLSSASPIQSIYPHPTSWRSILILSTHLRLGLPSGLFPSAHQDPIHPLSSPIRATCPADLILLDFITRTILGEECKSFSSPLCNLLYSSVTSSLLGPNILLNTIFSNTLSSLSSLNVSDQVLGRGLYQKFEECSS